MKNHDEQHTDERLTIFLQQRQRLLGLAYRMLGTRQDAEDVVQDAYLRFRSADLGEVRTPAAWLYTIVTRLCIDVLRRLKTEREQYIGPWLPEPWLGADEAIPSAQDAAELASDLSVGFLLMLDNLTPHERAAFLLREVFERDYSELAQVLGRSEVACRQLVHRAKEHLRKPATARPADDAETRRLLDAFLAAIKAGDEQALLATLAPSATLIGDGGGVVKAAAKPIHGGHLIARFLLGVTAAVVDRITGEPVQVNGRPGLALRLDGALASVLSVDVVDGRIAALYNVLNPHKLEGAKAVLN
jgi:RNA polymerase sigma-70 factor (ECF subfamily)